MFGHDSAPSRIYSYGARPPAEGAETVDSQMLLAHRYRNALVEAERKRRSMVEESLKAACPDLAGVEASIADQEKRLEAARDAIRKASAEARKKTRSPEAVEATKTAHEELKRLRGRRKGLRTGTFNSPAWEAEQERTDGWAGAEQRRLRSESGLYWGSYLLVESSMGNARSGAPPKFHRWDGGGHLAVQLQKGMSVADLFGCRDQRLRIEPVPEEAWMPGGRRLRRTRAWFRVGSTESGDPVWAVVPFVLHRPIPADCRIKWAHLLRRRIATNCVWRLQLVLAREAGWARPDAASDGAVGIDVGWRLRDDGSLRVAYWAGSDGREGEERVPADWLSEMRKTEDIRSIRDKNFNEARGAFSAWLKKDAPATPDWLKEACSGLPQWRSPGRLAAVAVRWRSDRFSGDEDGFAALEAWRKRDKHLYLYEANLRDQLLRRREDLYRNIAARLRRQYRLAVVEDLDLRDFHELPAAEADAPDGALRMHTRDACLSFLLRALKESMTEVVRAPAKDTTRRCASCGSIEEWDHKDLMHKCSGCGVACDQDRNAAINLLRAASAPVA